MTSTDRCPRCGALVLPQEKFCTQCGAPLAADDTLQAPAPQQAASQQAASQIMARPDSIEALKAYCDAKGMPLEKMRFFIDQDYREPRAFGIYRDGDGFVVYKNKANGSRAVRYHGPDEAYAVNELFQKLLDECHARGIYPDGKPQMTEAQRKAHRRTKRIVVCIVVVMALLFASVVFFVTRHHHSDGYYRYADGAYYYRYGSDWYYDDGDNNWVEVNDFPYDDYGDYYLGSDYDDSWATGDFRDSSAWESIHESHSDSSDYSSWDSGGTDWDSDW